MSKRKSVPYTPEEEDDLMRLYNKFKVSNPKPWEDVHTHMQKLNHTFRSPDAYRKKVQSILSGRKKRKSICIFGALTSSNNSGEARTSRNTEVDLLTFYTRREISNEAPNEIPNDIDEPRTKRPRLENEPDALTSLNNSDRQVHISDLSTSDLMNNGNRNPYESLKKQLPNTVPISKVRHHKF